MSISPFQKNDDEKNGPFVRLNMADDREARVSNTSDYPSWDTYNVANRRPLSTHKPRFYKQMYYKDDDANPNSPVKAILLFLTSASRYALIIFGVLALLWVPAILQFTLFNHGEIWGVALLRWSIWSTVFWGSWWGATIFTRTLPFILRNTVGKISAISLTYVGFIPSLTTYLTLFLWALASWVSLQPLIVNEINPNASSRSKTAVSFIDKLFFGFFLCAVVLLGEKIAIQFIAKHFHEQSYADRIEEHKASVEALIALYSHTTNIPIPPLPTLSAARDRSTFNSASPSVKPTTSVLRQVAKNLLGFSFLLPDSAESDVLTALCSANETRLLARRIFYSFVRPGETALVITDIAQYFDSEDEAMKAFNLFDRDGNSDVTQEEMEMACMECHNEQLSLANSLKDLDSAVGRLDNIFMTLYTFIAILILAVVLDSQLSTLLIGTGTFILGLSWLIGGSLTEVLTGIIFLFVKHPYDVGDRVVVDSIPYTVREIQLLSTILLDNNNTAFQAPHAYLAVRNIANIRRSPVMSETFTFDVAFNTKLESLETLRDQMLAFVKDNSRDFMPVFDVVIVDIPGQSMMTLSADIKYKSNWQHGTLKTQRRNRWLCALKECLSETKIYGPADAGAPPKADVPQMYTNVPWSEAKGMESATVSSDPVAPKTTPAPVSKIAVSSHDSLGHNNLLHKNAGVYDSSQNAFGEGEELAMSNPVLRSPKTPSTPKRDEDPRSH